MKKIILSLIIYLTFSHLHSLEIKLVKIFEGLNKPWSLSFIDENNILVTEKPGNLLIINLKNKTKSLISHNLSVVKKLINVSKKKIKIGSNVKIKFVKDRPGHDKRYAINSSKINNEIGWKPKISFMEGLKKTFVWYHKNQQYYSKLNKKDITKRIGIKR